MPKARIEAFSDGVIAILITIMVLELRAPRGTSWDTIRPLLPVFLTYVLSFAYLGIYWNNHHHMFHMTDRINGKILWANLHLLFWLSLIPLTTGWMGGNHLAPIPTAVYGFVLLLSALAYLMLQTAIIQLQGRDSRLKAAVGNDAKGKMSAILYLAAVVLAFVDSRVSVAIYIIVALIWIVPDKRIESKLNSHHGSNQAGSPRH
jgi:uncharacterized membrane protein